MPYDMLVKLWNLPDKMPLLRELEQRGITLKRVIAPDKGRVLAFVKEHFGDGWMHECEAALSTVPSTCYVAVKEKQIIGFSCFEATGKNYFGPIGVASDCREGGVGKALLLCCLHSMWEMGYAYAIVGWTDEAAGFYEKTVDAMIIPDSHPAIYKNMIRK